MFDGRAERSDSNFLPSVLGYWGAPLFQQDIPAAKALLAEAGYPDGFEMEIISVSDNIYVSGSEVMQAQLAEAGIKAKIIVVESAAATELSLAGKYDSRISNWTAVSDPHIYVTYYKSGEKWNYPHWSNSEFDNAVNAGGVETNQKARADYYTKAQQIWDAEIAGVPLTHGVNAMATRQGVDLGTLYPGGELAIWTMSKN
jgi:peptide/nickel transport system substrate-binding protein